MNHTCPNPNVAGNATQPVFFDREISISFLVPKIFRDDIEFNVRGTGDLSFTVESFLPGDGELRFGVYLHDVELSETVKSDRFYTGGDRPLVISYNPWNGWTQYGKAFDWLAFKWVTDKAQALLELEGIIFP